MAESILQTPDEALGGLPVDGLTIALAGMAKGDPKDVGLVLVAILDDSGASAEFHRGFLAGETSIRWKGSGLALPTRLTKRFTEE